MKGKKEYLRALQATLEEWNVDIDILTNKVSDVSAEVRAEYNEQITLLKEKQAAVRQKTEELPESGGSARQDLKADLIWPGAPSAKPRIRLSPFASKQL